MNRSVQIRQRGFSLIELVIVVVIIGIIAAIAIPRMSRGSAGAADSALRANLAVLRNAMELYRVEHEGKLPTLTNIGDQLTKKTDVIGNVEGGGTGGPFVFGPYLRAVPPLPVGAAKGQTTFVATQGGTTAGWVYNATTGEIIPNTDDTEVDAASKAYNTY